MKSFLSIFKSILHAAEAAATIAAPIVKAVDPVIGSLMTQAVNAAVLVEGVATTASGQQKAEIVSQMSQASINLANSLLTSQGKNPLPAGIQTAIDATVKNVVDSLNTVAAVADSAAPAKVAVAAASTQQSTTSILDAK